MQNATKMFDKKTDLPVHHINLIPGANILLLANLGGLAIFQLQLKILMTSLRLVLVIEMCLFFL